jgi:hypothetical protein
LVVLSSRYRALRALRCRRRAKRLTTRSALYRKLPYRPEVVAARAAHPRSASTSTGSAIRRVSANYSTRMISQAFKVGFPIRISMDQSSFAAPHGFSQRITSFFACACQGIHQMPLRHLIVLIANAHQYSRNQSNNSKLRRTGYLLQPILLMMPSTCST